MTPVAPLKTLVEIIMIAPGKNAKAFRVHCAEMLTRVFARDMAATAPLPKGADAPPESIPPTEDVDVPLPEDAASSSTSQDNTVDMTNAQAECEQRCLSYQHVMDSLRRVKQSDIRNNKGVEYMGFGKVEQPKSETGNDEPAVVTEVEPSEEVQEVPVTTEEEPVDDSQQDTVININVAVRTPLGKELQIENRDEDGFFRRKGIFAAWDTAYYATKDMDETIVSLKLVKSNVYKTDKTTGAWISPALARGMAKKAGLTDQQIREAFDPEDAVPKPNQPQLDGLAGKLLVQARKVRPCVPGHARALEFVRSLGGMVIRAHGSFIDASLLLKSVDKFWSHFWESESHKQFFSALLKKRQAVWSDLVIFQGPNGIFVPPRKSQDAQTHVWDVDVRRVTGIWVEGALGIKMASWGNKPFEVEVCDLVLRHMQGHLSAEELSATQTLLNAFKGDAQNTDARNAPAHDNAPMHDALTARQRGVVWESGGDDTHDEVTVVFGHTLLKVVNPRLDMDVPPGFGHREVFYLLFHGLNTVLGVPLWELGCTQDMQDRMSKGHSRTPFPTARIVIMFATDKSPSKLIETPAKRTHFKDLLTKIDSNTEVFHASKAVTIQRVKDLYNKRAHMIVDTYVDTELGLDEHPFTGAKHALGNAQLVMAREETVRMKEREATIRSQEETKRALLQTKRALLETKRALVTQGYSVGDMERILAM